MNYSDALDEHAKLLDYWRTIAGNKVASTLKPGTVEAAGVYLFGIVALAPTFYVSKEIVSLLKGVSASLPDNAVFTQDLLPAGSGFLWMESGIPINKPSIRGNATELRCITWHIDERKGIPGIYMMLHEKESNFATFPGVVGVVFWPFGATLPEAELAIPDDTEPADASEIWSWFYSLLAFMRDAIFTTTVSRANRAALRRKPESWDHEPLVNVIQLRRVHKDHPSTNDPTHRDWSHQWLVSGHWRQQWYPSIRRRQPKWIAPYVKGPEGKPLKAPRPTVFAVTR